MRAPDLHFELAPAPADLAPLWRDLESRADPPFFLSWHWIGTWVATIADAPMLLTGRAAGTVVLLGLLLPSKQRTLRLWPTHGLRLHTTGDEAEDVITIEYNGFLVARSWEGRAETAAIAFLNGGIRVGRRRWDELHLRGVPDRTEALLPPGVLTQVASRKPSWRVDLDAVRQSGRPYLDHLSANTRQQIRRALRLYEGRTGRVDATRARTPEEATIFLRGLQELHQSYWQARGEPGAFAHPFYVRFLDRLIERCLPEHAIELVRIGSADRAIGYLCNFRYRGQIYAYLSGFLYDADPKLKPGLVSHALCIETHLRGGAAIYDFMAGDNRYKASLGVPGPDMLYLIARRPTVAARLERNARVFKRRLRGLAQSPRWTRSMRS
jgi:CelD/BcsL family acetyltransferase involved in cellulose biosynthesis